MIAADAISAGSAHVVVAGGMEGMSGAPYLLKKARSGYQLGHGEFVDSIINDGLWTLMAMCIWGRTPSCALRNMSFHAKHRTILR